MEKLTLEMIGSIEKEIEIEFEMRLNRNGFIVHIPKDCLNVDHTFNDKGYKLLLKYIRDGETFLDEFNLAVKNGTYQDFFEKYSGIRVKGYGGCRDTKFISLS